MNKKQRLDFEAFLRTHADTVLSCKGNDTELEKAIVSASGKYTALQNKTLFFDLIGKGGMESAPSSQISAERLITNVMTRIRRKEKTKRFLFAFLAAFLLLGILIVFPWILSAENESETFSCMDTACVISGEQGNAALVNYQNLTKLLQKKARPDSDQGRIMTPRHMVSVCTAPDGTPYMSYHNLETEDGGYTTFTLYRGEKDGWHLIANAEVEADWMLALPQYDIYQFRSSELYTVVNREGSVYTVSRLKETIQIHKYDEESGTLTVMATLPFTYLDFYREIEIVYDAEEGECGVFYLIANDTGDVNIFRYDTAEDTIALFGEQVKLTYATGRVLACVQDGIVYLAETSSKGFFLRRVTESGKSEPICITEETYLNRIEDIGIDEDGTVYILTRINNDFTYYTVLEDGTVAKAPLPRLYYENTAYIAECIGFLRDQNGNLCYMQRFEGEEGSFIAIGRPDPSSEKGCQYLDGFDIPDYIVGAFVLNGNELLFLAADIGEDVYRESICYTNVLFHGKEK